jgi:hypothetical protein
MSKQGWGTVIAASFSLALTVTPIGQSWSLAGVAWFSTAFAGLRWYLHHRRETETGSSFTGKFFPTPPATDLADTKSGNKEIGSRLLELYNQGIQLRQTIFESTDAMSAEMAAQEIQEYRKSFVDYIAAIESPAKAASIDAVPQSVMAVAMLGMKSVETRHAKTVLLQKLDIRLEKVADYMGQF